MGDGPAGKPVGLDSPSLDVLRRHNVNVSGREDGPAMVFAHGFGCDQNMWRFVAPAFEADHRVVLFDHLGAGASDASAYDPARYDRLDAYAEDVLEICRALELTDATFVGHSVSSMIGALAAERAPERIGRLVMVGPSPRYIDDEDYVGGFKEQQIAELLDFLAETHMGWYAAMARLNRSGDSSSPKLKATRRYRCVATMPSRIPA